ncbi:hypothetical protein HNR44_002419 [Geomicrobium halophilum]|uniref:SLH domain-containing protein n=1 Tax=Geomicrobium halophilum TaxID=549000 RepID=A0A841PTD1_9BACL|nr:S-layer homology domain-containing protein [Geomicrobium halophilum]MBB6450436.1 hypothetical protein [Geomicrobium halophilum]
MAYQPKSYRKFIAGTMTAAMAASAFAVSTPQQVADAQDQTFSDVSPDYWAFEDIERIAERGIVTGYEDGTYGPGESISRGQIAEMIANAVGLDVPDREDLNEVPFEDLTTNSYSAPVAVAVQEAGIMQGREGGTQFDVATDLSREQMATILVRAFDLEDLGIDHGIEDIDDVHASHVENVKILGQYGITSTEDGVFDPQTSVTRAQMASFLERALNVSHTIDSGLIDIEAVNENTVDIAFERPQEDVDVDQFAFNDEELAVLDVQIVGGEENVVRLTTSDQNEDQLYELYYNDERTTLTFTGSGDLEAATPTNVEGVTDGSTWLTTITADVLGAGEDDTADITVTTEDLDDENIEVEEVEIVDGKLEYTFEEPLPVGTHIAVVSVGDVDSEPVELTVEEPQVESIEAITHQLLVSEAPQQLGFTVNSGDEMLIGLLEELGYQVQFNYNSAVINSGQDQESLEAGLVNTSKLAEDTFVYQVEILDAEGNRVALSNQQTVELSDASEVTKVTEVGLLDGDEEVAADTVTSNNDGAIIQAVEGLNAFGEPVEDLEDLKLGTVTSSDVTVAFYDPDNGLRVLDEGEVTLTVEFEGVNETVDLSLTIVEEEEITSVKGEGETLGFSTNSEGTTFTILDQYGEKWSHDQEVNVNYEITKNDEVVSAGSSNINDGNITVDFDDITEEGDYNLTFTFDDEEIGSVTLRFVDIEEVEVDEFTLTAELESIDIFEEHDEEFEFTIEATHEGIELSPEEISDALNELDGNVQATTSNEDVVSFEGDETLNYEEGVEFSATPESEGTATISLEQVDGDFTYELSDGIEVTVENSTPEITGLELTDEEQPIEVTGTEEGWAISNFEQLTVTSDDFEGSVENFVKSVEFTPHDELAVITIKDEYGGETFALPAVDVSDSVE